MTPTGCELAQVDALLEKSCRISNLVLSSNFSRIEMLMAYKTTWYPMVSYSLSVTTMTPPQLRKIQSMATQSFLAKMGINRNYPRRVTNGPIEYGGLDFPDLAIEQGISQIRLLMEHISHDSEADRLLQICIQTIQAEAGTGVILLHDPKVVISYLTPCWILSLRTFMGHHQISLQFSDCWNFNLSRERDSFLMNLF
jgi:hypothetical protein